MNGKYERSSILVLTALLLLGCENGSSVSTDENDRSNSKSITNEEESSASQTQSGTEGVLTDSRDGKTYKTIVIGTQTWMAQNLNYAVDSSWCYNKAVSNCTKYGRLYLWSSVMKIATLYDKRVWTGSDVLHQGICPSGWHIPNDSEMQRLSNYARDNNGSGKSGIANSLKAKNGWSSGNGSDLFGFAGLPGGVRNFIGEFSLMGTGGCYWSSTQKEASSVYRWCLNNNGQAFIRGNYPQRLGSSLRCVKNE